MSSSKPIQIRCLFDEMVPCADLKPHPKNRNKHPKDQIHRLAKILIFQGIRAPIVVSRQSGFIVKGHGTLKSIIVTGQKDAPVVYQDFESDEVEYAFIQADNAIALWAELDLDGIKTDLKDMPDIDVELLGIEDFSLDSSGLGSNGSSANSYTDKIKIPIYEPKGQKPKIEELFDLQKYISLAKEIEASNVEESIKTFLMAAAQRHVVFNYELIAEYYCHASKDVQNLMEKSALVIIDFNKAIENGFVKLSEAVSEAYLNENE